MYIHLLNLFKLLKNLKSIKIKKKLKQSSHLRFLGGSSLIYEQGSSSSSSSSFFVLLALALGVSRVAKSGVSNVVGLNSAVIKMFN